MASEGYFKNSDLYENLKGQRGISAMGKAGRWKSNKSKEIERWLLRYIQRKTAITSYKIVFVLLLISSFVVYQILHYNTFLPK